MLGLKTQDGEGDVDEVTQHQWVREVEKDGGVSPAADPSVDPLWWAVTSHLFVILMSPAVLDITGSQTYCDCTFQRTVF